MRPPPSVFTAVGRRPGWPSRAPTANYGTLSTLEVDRSPNLESYLSFDLADLDRPVVRATLRLFVTNKSSNAPKVYSSAIGWSETGLTWNTRPARGALLADLGAVAAGGYVQYDVTAAVSRNGDVSFALVADSTDGTDFNAREATTNRPQLVVETRTKPPRRHRHRPRRRLPRPPAARPATSPPWPERRPASAATAGRP